jgi:general nucleoside transport system ATP-binding protein
VICAGAEDAAQRLKASGFEVRSTRPVMTTTLDENVLVSRYREADYTRWGLLRMDNVRRLANWVRDTYRVSGAHPGEGIATLSGGNLQKIVLGRELSGSPSCVVANQPTRGLDVGSIEFVHRTLLDARDAGAAVLVISAEIDEIRALSDRILVLYRGRIAGEMTPDEATDEALSSLGEGGVNQRAMKEAA